MKQQTRCTFTGVFAPESHVKYVLNLLPYLLAIFMRRKVRKRTFWNVRPTKTQISLRIRAVWSESSLSARRNFASLAIRNAPSEDSDQTVRMHRLILIFTGGSCPRAKR